jgi:uridine kinase
MFVIIEGAKFSGKSTLCAKLQAKFGGEIIHFPTNSELGKRALAALGTPECQSLMLLDIETTLDNLDPSKLWILDRSFISNSVYSMKPIQRDRLDTSMIIILCPTNDKLDKRVKLRVNKPATDYELSQLHWSNGEFHHVAKLLECVKITEIHELVCGKYMMD